ETLDVVRLSIMFVGTELSDDDEEEPTAVHIQADLEYSLHHNQAWMPHSQVLLVRWEVPFFRSASLWFTMTTEFTEYEINTDVAPSQPPTKASADRTDRSSWDLAWRCDDVMMFGEPGTIRTNCGQGSLEHAGMVNGINYSVRVPALDSLLAFPFETELSLFSSSAERERTDRVIADLAHVAAGLPGSLAPTRVHHSFGRNIGQLASIPRFNRVQGFSVGAAVELPVPLAFTAISASARFGIADERPVGSVAWIRNAPESRFELTAFRSLTAVEPWTNARSLGTSLKAAILGWDDADYYLSLGGGMKFRGRMGPLRNITLELNFERQRSVVTATGSAVNDFFLGDGIYPANPAIVAGDFGRASLGYSNSWSRFALALAVDGLAGDSLHGGRAWAAISAPFSLGNAHLKLDAKAGSVFGDSLPQLEFRVGGPATVPRYEYGVLRGESLWSVQVEAELFSNDWVAPVVFGGVGGLWDASDPLIGIGLGASLLQNWFRIDFSKGINPSRAIRLDIYFQIPN
ncbi:MAG: hypothetical protein V3R24_08990, partial [Gemmatimonadales bacterium]